MTLFLMNAVAGRIWCGCLCWQTIWTDLFYAMERWGEAIPVTFTAQARLFNSLDCKSLRIAF